MYVISVFTQHTILQHDHKIAALPFTKLSITVLEIILIRIQPTLLF